MQFEHKYVDVFFAQSAQVNAYQGGGGWLFPSVCLRILFSNLLQELHWKLAM